MTDPLDRLKTALADRYAIERELGRGGMAVVYLAHDQKLNRQVALKVLRPELAASLGSERFLREIEIAAKLTHPNILGLHDCGEADGQLYYTMPFVEGESLRDRLNREKQLSIEDALRITKEVADALGHAHSLGIVHRDIKPENILFTAGHAMVSDFGIARAVTEAGAATLTETGLAVGTPAYMSPEQAAGNKDLDARSDLYSLGCVLYEMLSGETPFLGNTPQAIVAKKLTEPPPRVSVVRDRVPTAVEAALDRVLARTPADRFVTAQQFVEALAAPSAAVTPSERAAGAPMQRRGKRPAPYWGAGLGAAAVIVAAGVLLLNGGEPGAESEAAEEVVDRLIVAPLEDRTGDPAAADWGFMAAEFVTRAVDRTGVVTVVPASVVRDKVREVDPAAGMPLEELARRTGARYAVAGTYSASAGRVRFDVELVEAGTGEMLRSLDPVSGSVDSLEAVMALLAERVTAATMARLGHGDNPSVATWTSPPSRDALRAQLGTQDLFCRGRWQDAIDEARTGLNAAPDFAPLLILVLVAQSNLRRYREADSVLTLLEPLSGRLTTPERLVAEWMHGSLYGDQAEETRAVEQLFRLHPSVYGYQAAVTAMRENRVTDALERLLAHDLDTPCYRLWAAWWSVTAQAYHLLGRHEDELAVARRGLERFPDHVEIAYFEVAALVGLGRLGAVDSLIEGLRDLPARPGFTLSLHPAFVALELKAHGHREAYEAAMERSLAWFATRPAAELRYERGRAFYYAERWIDADTLFAALIASTPDTLDYRGYRAVALAHLGRREEALETDRWLARLDRPFLQGVNTRWRAAIAAALGDRERAVRLLEQAIREGMNLGYYHHRDPEWATLRDYRPYQTLVRPKG